MYGKVSVLFKYFHDAHTTLAPNFTLRYTEFQMDVKIINPFLVSCENAFKKVLKKREIQQILVTAINLDVLCEQGLLLEPLQSLVWKDEGTFGVGSYSLCSIIWINRDCKRL